jgi:hypothetical protein
MGRRDGNSEPGPEARPPDVAQFAEVTAAARRRRNGLVAGLVAALVVVAIPVVVLRMGGSGSDGSRPAERGDARQVVLAAAGATAASGRYDITFTDHVTPGNDPARCTAAPLPTDANAGGNVGTVATPAKSSVSTSSTSTTEPHPLTTATTTH